ncbi:hypothetical protein BHE74_00038881 [Ensete ventricosum]|nr:hypothetical protein GW17_00056336 [Ensete ventricosum]RWW54532.1 hypothetical protein BHE74_00038881 [Ensete ventricosum]RZR82306.1 hypothetical protein BHM03_00008691 [Ensete ventricosum]
MGGGVGEDEVRGDGDENAQEEERPEDYCMPNIGLVNAHPPKVGPEAPELFASTGEATCIRCPARQQRLGAAAGGRFHDNASSRH